MACQVDINNVFLHGYLDKDIYMQAPDDYFVQLAQVCKLKMSLYGLKQVFRQWNLKVTNNLLSFGFVQSPYVHCLFTQQTNVGLVALLVYVDDILITCSSKHKIVEIKKFLDATFTIKDLDLAKYFLGLEIARSSIGMSIIQHKFILEIQDTGLLSCFLSPACRLLYLSFTRLDISFGAQQLSQYVHAPRQHHLEAALHRVRYLKGCPESGLFFPVSNSFTVSTYCDADWASCTDSPRFLTVFCIFLSKALISWKTKKQMIVARSTVETKYHNLGSTVCELQWITYLLLTSVFKSPVLFLYTLTTKL
ncbi:UNVERIFIED_CONTAM: Retrovirus-related Pol polyprotein from transposon RE1 [Sesamum indicum]